MIDLSKSKQYTLSIRLSTDGFSFSIYNPILPDDSTVVERQTDCSLSLTANLKAAFQELDFLSHSYKRVNVMMASKRFTVMPSELFDEAQAELLLYHNHPKREHETVLFNPLHKNSIMVVFGMDKSAHHFLRERYPEAHFYAQATPFIECFIAKSRLGNNKKMYAYLHAQRVDIYCFNRGQLLLANSFECAQTDDRTYYLLYTWKQLEFDQERDELHLTGSLPDKELLMSKLRKYVRHVFITNPTSDIDLHALPACE